MKNIILLFFFTSLASLIQAQKTAEPIVFQIGEQDELFEKLTTDCSTFLLSVCNDDMSEAFQIWTQMVVDIELAAIQAGFDIKGVKIWMNTYWNPDGSIKSYTFYPKPNSKNMDYNILSDFLKEFATNYKIPKAYSSCFSHFGSASFPSFTEIRPKKP